MQYQYDYDHDYLDGINGERGQYSELFPNTEEALFSLYEELFCNRKRICKKTILEAMKYLIFSHDMPNQQEEIHYMTTDEVDVVHHREVDEAIQETTKEFKEKLYEILENKLF